MYQGTNIEPRAREYLRHARDQLRELDRLDDLKVGGEFISSDMEGFD